MRGMLRNEFAICVILNPVFQWCIREHSHYLYLNRVAVCNINFDKDIREAGLRIT